ncbi:unnamed protein product [Colias eurytheme]|nr:unnamed protein product [Colias eurytheme]
MVRTYKPKNTSRQAVDEESMQSALLTENDMEQLGQWTSGFNRKPCLQNDLAVMLSRLMIVKTICLFCWWLL